MITMKKKALVLSIMCAVASTGFVMNANAEETMNSSLDEIIINEQQP